MCIKILIKCTFPVALIAIYSPEIAAACEKPVATVISTQGRVEVQSSGSSNWRKVGPEDKLCDGDVVHTSKWSRVTIIRPSGSGFTMPQNGTLTVTASSDAKETDKEKQPAWYIRLLQGKAFFRSRQPERIDIQTPYINVVHKGTEFLVAVESGATEIDVFDGQVLGENSAGKIEITKGFKGIAPANRPPRVQALTIAPEDAVQWALYYPPILDFNDQKPSAQDSRLSAASTAYRNGDIGQALDILETIPAPQHNACYLNKKAGLLLAAGRVDEAEPLISQAQQQEPGNSQALALQAVIAVAKNRQQAALELANKAAAADPKSAVAKIAQSYAYQALFKIDDALTAAQAATRLDPNNALAWARLAELELSAGDRPAAVRAAQKAQALNPKLAHTHTVLGFANLAQNGIAKATHNFGQALALDSSAPLARLGLGLAKIRQGDLEGGKRDLESAVNTDPNNAIIRSYLGKAYYELRDKDFAGKEFEIAKAMDPKDPTPYFYDAILKQTTNRPVEALHTMQQAIELNDNRGVYRSSLLMDKDLAARSAAQGRIYNELGFQQRGLLEGWKSVNTDNTNYSAHRLLADNYAALPRHELARVSELLQSQLLQPVNITPIQPNLAESNLFILNSLGPSDLSYNEFNPLFEYNRLAFQASGLYGSNNTIGDNATISGLHDNISFSLGQFHYETDGFRDNNFLKKDLYNAFVQAQVTDDLNLQAEYRHEEKDNGDLIFNFNADNFSADYRENTTVDSYRIGGNFKFNSNSNLLGSLIYQDIEISQKSDGLNSKTKRSGYISQLQHIYNNSNINIINGFGNINQDSLTNFDGFEIDSSTQKTNIYNYSRIGLGDTIKATIGLSVDFINIGETIERNRINPKFGIEWNPMPSTNFRAAAFRGLYVNQVASQTLEPTQVAGFNQFFNDTNGTSAWRYGAGVDHRFTKYLSAGLEYSERKLDDPFTNIKQDRSEQLARAYVYFTPIDQLSLSSEYFYERISQPNIFMNRQDGFFHLSETHRIPLTLSFFHSTGLSFKIRNTFVHQSGLFQSCAFCQESTPGNSNFFLVDLSLGYRLPYRYGIINLGVNNLFDDRNDYQNTSVNSNEVIFAPERIFYSRITLAF